MLQELVEFAQRQFGELSGIPADLGEGRPRLPGWLEGHIEDAARIEDGDRPLLEGTPDETTAGEEPREGASVEEFFAYYLPFHFYQTNWGIYIRGSGIDRLARQLTIPGPVTPASVSFVFRLLLEHERLHFLAEIAASKLEVVFCQPSYVNYLRDNKAALHEEAVANAHALSFSKHRVAAPLAKTAESWMTKQGPGYRDFRQWMGAQLPLGHREAVASMVRAAESYHELLVSDPKGSSVPYIRYSVPRKPSDGPGEFLFEERRNRKMFPPTYLVQDIQVPWLRVVKPFPKLYGLQVEVHTNDHQPPHIHITMLNNGDETRYAWPALCPLNGDKTLSRSKKKNLDDYVNEFGDKIEKKIKTVQWH